MLYSTIGLWFIDLGTSLDGVYPSLWLNNCSLDIYKQKLTGLVGHSIKLALYPPFSSWIDVNEFSNDNILWFLFGNENWLVINVAKLLGE